ncbi:MAG: hypothetical protein M9962_14545 [Oligoflexia bacterium]|nr:hypothetical protein [Oligoflexia bacterium]
MSLFALLFFTNIATAATTWNSVYTDIEKDCITISESNDQADIDFYEAECKSFGGYQLKISGGDLRYAPTLTYKGKDLSMGRPWAFHDLGSTKVEWMYTLKKEADGSGSLDWKGFIYRLYVDKGESTGDLGILFAVRLDGTKSCFLGNPKTNEAARELIKNKSAKCIVE